MGVPANYKHQFLADTVREALGQFAPEVDALFDKVGCLPRIEMSERSWRFSRGRSVDERIRVMGRIPWYCEVMFTGPTETMKETEAGAWLGGAHQFTVALFFAYKDADNYEDTSASLFHRMTDAEGEKYLDEDNARVARDGLMVFLRDSGFSMYAYDVPDPTVDAPDRTESLIGSLSIVIREDGEEQTYGDLRSLVLFDNAANDRAHLLQFKCYVVDQL